MTIFKPAFKNSAGRFLNPYGHEHKKKRFLDILKWWIAEQRGEWPKWHSIDPICPKKVLEKNESPRITFVNHSTLLIQFPDLNILTDPVWSDRTSPIPWLGPKRVTAPGIAKKDLPPIHGVFLTHNHYDHFDWSTIRWLKNKFSPQFFVPKGFIKQYSLFTAQNAIELDWGEHCAFCSLDIFFIPALHWSLRYIGDYNKTLWGGYWFCSSKKSIYFAGDTAFGTGQLFQDIKTAFGSPSVACLPIGAYKPDYIMKASHLAPYEAVQAHKILHPKQSIALHHYTFCLSDEGWLEPQQDLAEALKMQNLPAHVFKVLLPGHHLSF